MTRTPLEGARAEPEHAPPDAESVLEPTVDSEAPARPAEPGAPAPDVTKLVRALEGRATRSVAITILAVLGVLYTFYFARAVMIPLTFAMLLNFLLSPATRGLARLRIPTPAGAALVVLALVGLLALGTYALIGPVQTWIARAPQTLAATEHRLQRFRKPVEQVTRTAEQVESATSVSGSRAAREVVLRGPSLAQRVFGTTESFFVGLLEVLVLLCFLLAGGDLFLQKLVQVIPQLRDKKTAVRIARETEASISMYLSTVALVNVVEGIVIASVMALLSMPNAVLWGVLTALLEFIPYLGATAMVAILTLAGLTTFSSTGHALLVPASYLAINLIQANLVTPLLLGRRLTLNPVAIFVGLMFWFFIWGIPGAFVAVPFLATLKIVCDHVEALAPIGALLGRRTDGARAAAEG